MSRKEAITRWASMKLKAHSGRKIRVAEKTAGAGDSQQDSVVRGHPVLLVTCPAQSPQAVIVMTIC